MIRRIPLETVAKIKDLVRAGKTYREIQAETGVSAPTIAKYRNEVEREKVVKADANDIPAESREALLARHREICDQLDRSDNEIQTIKLRHQLDMVGRKLNDLNKAKQSAVVMAKPPPKPDPHILMPEEPDDEDEDLEDEDDDEEEVDDETSPTEPPVVKPRPKPVPSIPQPPDKPNPKTGSPFMEQLEAWADEAGQDAVAFDRVINWLKKRDAR